MLEYIKIKKKNNTSQKNMVEANKIGSDGEEEFTDSNLPLAEKESEDNLIR